MSIYVSVTKDHIKRGKKISTCNCPIALAIKDALKLVKGVYVNPRQVIRYVNPYTRIIYQTTGEMLNWMVAFDKGQKVEPFKFQLLMEGEVNA